MPELQLYIGTNSDIGLGTSFNISIGPNIKLEELMLVVKYSYE
jgi:hypothetical protein